MIGRLFGVGTSAAELRGGLTDTSQSLRSIAHRVANATNGVPGGSPGFGDVLQATDTSSGPALAEEVDIETEMVRLADEQIRYDTSATLLQRVYVQLRASVRGV